MVIARISRAEGVGIPMNGKIQTRLALLAALAALVAVVVPATLAFGSHNGGISNPGPAEYVFLRLGNVDEFRFGDQAEVITGKNNCTATTFAGPDLMNLVGTGGAVGFVKDGFGVRSAGDGNGEPCGRVEFTKGEKISVKLGSALADYLMTAVDVDLELKFGAKVFVEYIHEDTVVATHMFDPSDAADDGPDSGDLDNFRYLHRPMSGDNPRYFDEVRFTPTAGALSLEGGADGTDAGDLVTSNNWSQFEIVKGAFDGDIDCGDTDTLTKAGVSTTGDVTMHSEDLGAGWKVDPNCVLKPYNFDVTDSSLSFVPELTGTTARYTIEVTVEDQVITVDGNGQITSLVAEYNPEGDLSFPSSTTEPLQACEGEPNLDIGSAAYNTFWTQTDVGLLPDGENACWYHASVEPTSAGFGTEVWGIYFEDDPGFSFR